MNEALSLFLALIVYGAVTWRITSLLTVEYGPAHIFARLRELLGVRFNEFSQCEGKNVLAEALCCFKCSSIWVGVLVIALWAYTPEPLIFVARVLFVSTVAIYINGRVGNGAR